MIALLSRALGPDLYGIYASAQSLYQIFLVLTGLGLLQVVTRELVQAEHEKHQEILSSALFIQILSGLVNFALLAFFALYIGLGTPGFFRVAMLLGGSLLFQFASVATYWFTFRLELGKLLFVEQIVLWSTAIPKVLIIFSNEEALFKLMLFASVVLVENFLVSFVRLYLVARDSRFPRWFAWDPALCGRLISECPPFAFSAMSVVLYSNIDSIMLLKWSGSIQSGLYAVSRNLTDLWLFIPLVVNQSFRPVFLRLWNKGNSDAFGALFCKVLARLVASVFLIVCLINVFSRTLIAKIFGPDFLLSQSTLLVLSLSALVSVVNNTGWAWFVAIRKEGLANKRLFIGLVANIVLNLALIPAWGALGAAVATLVSRLFVSYFGLLFDPASRKLFLLINSSLFFGKRPSLKSS